MINHRLFEQYRIDTKKDLKIKNLCPRPKDTILIDKQGSCYACECQSWLPQSIGNLQIKSLEEIIGGEMHQHLQSSITDGTYRYCNEHQCSYIKSGVVFQPPGLDHTGGLDQRSSPHASSSSASSPNKSSSTELQQREIPENSKHAALSQSHELLVPPPIQT